MTRRRPRFPNTLLLAMVTLSLTGLAPRADAMVGDTALPECEGVGLPRILDLGLPQVDGTDPRELRQRIDVVLHAFGPEAARCPQQPLQVNLAVGSHYQILDWLGEGVLDAAVVPALSHHLLHTDGVAVRHLRLSGDGRDRLTPAWRRKLVSVNLENGTGATYRDHPVADLDLFIASLWTPPRDDWPAEMKADRAAADPHLCPEPEGRDGFRRLALPSHLSTTGFLDPVAQGHTWVEDKLTRVKMELRPALRECFWRAFFEHTCFYFDAAGATAGDARGHGDRGAAPLCAGGDDGLEKHRIEIQVRRQPAGDGTAGAAPAIAGEVLPRPPTRDRLLIREQAARDLFSEDALDDPERFATYPGSVLPAWNEVADLFGAGGIPVPGPFRSLVQPDPYFGLRTFSFTVDETLDLLRLHQLTSRRSGLALVLPGGGVKSVYQSRLLDELYGENHLRNYRVAQDGALAVEYVVGTSGGALLGVFVARQGEETSWNLSDILWKKKSDDGKLVPLTSADLFPPADLLRYVSVIAIFILFCVVLALASLPHWGPLSPERAGSPQVEQHPSFRPRLLLVLGAALLTAPLMVRWLGDLGTLEHTPEIEGLLYAVLVVLTLFADQSLIFDPDRKGEPAEHPSVLSPVLLAGLGGLLLAIPVAARLAGGKLHTDWLAEPISFRTAYVVIAASILVVILASSREFTGRRRWISAAGWLGGALVASAVGYALLLTMEVPWLERTDDWPLLLFGLSAVILLLGLGRLAGWLRHRPSWQRVGSSLRFDALRGHPVPPWLRRVLGRGLKGVMLVTGSLVFLDLCRPSAESFRTDPEQAGVPTLLTEAHTLLAEESRLLVDAGALIALIGLILLAVAWVLWLGERKPAYRFTEIRHFVSAFFFVGGGLTLAVCGLIIVAGRLWEGEFTLFELSASFWRALLVSSLALSMLLVAWGVGAKRLGDPLSLGLRRTLLYLAGRHPNGHVISRRFVRMALVLVGGVVWWNLVLAPAVYGNRVAREYLADAEERFGGGMLNTDGSGAVRPFQSRLLAPANALAEKGTHFVLVVPESDPCPPVRQARGSGVTWHRFRALSGGEHPGHGTDDPCIDVDLTRKEGKDDLLSFVFASGSPFPVFPAHRVGMVGNKSKDEGDDEGKLLVDGGYSNNVPVEAAAMVEAAQMLIVHTSSPLECDEAGNWGWLMKTTGPLIRNALHLPGFLFERSQQVDRRSRQGAFVASLAPLCRPDWPNLTEFSNHRVEYLLKAAEADLDRRIGRVESWGPVRFQGGVRLDEAGAAGG